MRNIRMGASGALALGAIFAMAAQAQTYSVLHTFTGSPADGSGPNGNLLLDSAGNLYGTAPGGGSAGYGVVFKLSKSGQETVLYSFTGGADGAYPYGSLIQDSYGNLYGTTVSGGYGLGFGVVFKLDPAGTETVLYTFTGGADGSEPYAGVIPDAEGDLYGTTYVGGASGAGTVFKLDKAGTETVLYSFSGGADGMEPYAGLTWDAAGNLCGTTFGGGASHAGTVFTVDTAGVETVLYSFKGGAADGALPYGGVVRDPAGNLYGTTYEGGAAGLGVVFELDTSGVETVLHSFAGAGDGANPCAGLIRDAAGKLYGTTLRGGSTGLGTVFKVDAAGIETVLHIFIVGGGGTHPRAGLIGDKAGNLFGATQYGGAFRSGVVFRLKL